MANKDVLNQVVGKDSGQQDAAVDASSVHASVLESLSAMMDDQATDLDVRRVVTQLEGDAELLDYWRRYHLVRELVKPELQIARKDVLASVKARLQAEANPAAVKPLQRLFYRRGFRLAGQGVIAATVALAVLLVYPRLHGDGTGSPSTELLAQASAGQQQAAETLPKLSGELNDSRLTRTVSLDDAARKRLEKAVRNFSGTAAVLNADSMPMFVNQLEPFNPGAKPVDKSESRR